MKAAPTTALLLIVGTAAFAQSPSEEFDKRIPSSRPQPTLQLGGATGNTQVRVIDIGRRAPRSGPGAGQDESEAEYRQRRIEEADAWHNRTHVRPDPLPPSPPRCEGATCIRR